MNDIFSANSPTRMASKWRHNIGRVSPFSCGYLEESTARSLVEDFEQIGRLLQGMMDKAESFYSASRIAEDTPAAESMAAEDPLTPDW
jgi:hypothetical protein